MVGPNWEQDWARGREKPGRRARKGSVDGFVPVGKRIFAISRVPVRAEKEMKSVGRDVRDGVPL